MILTNVSIIHPYCQVWNSVVSFSILPCVTKIMYCYIKCMVIWPNVIDRKVHVPVFVLVCLCLQLTHVCVALHESISKLPVPTTSQKQSKNSKNWANLKIKHVKSHFRTVAWCPGTDRKHKHYVTQAPRVKSKLRINGK